MTELKNNLNERIKENLKSGKFILDDVLPKDENGEYIIDEEDFVDDSDQDWSDECEID